MVSSRHIVRAALIGSLLLQPRLLFAEPSATEKETARGLMEAGRALRENQDLNGALARFSAADSIMGVPTTGFELARSQVDLGRLIEARGTLRRVLALPRTEREPLPFEQARQKAEELDAELELRIASLRFVVSGVASGTTVRLTVDGQPVPTAELQRPFRVDPGRHQIEAKSASATVERELEISEREVLDVRLDLRGAPRAAAEPFKPEAGAAPSRSLRKVTYVAGGVGAAGIVVGGVSGALALTSKHSATQGCKAQQCPPSTWADLDRASTLATVSTVSFVVAAVGVAIGLGSLIYDRKPSPARVQANFSAAKGVGSFSLTGRF